jgi:hypothetical protein
MKNPNIEVKKNGDDVICKITYDNIVVEAGYKPDGSVYSLPKESIDNISLEFTRIGCKMWDEVWEKFDMNPGYALEKGLIDLKYCNQMQFAHIIGYDLCNMECNNSKSNRDMLEFFETKLN